MLHSSSRGFGNRIGTHFSVRIEPLPIPNNPAFVGVELFCQWLVEDAAGTPLPGFLGLSTSRGGRVHVGL